METDEEGFFVLVLHLVSKQLLCKTQMMQNRDALFIWVKDVGILSESY